MSGMNGARRAAWFMMALLACACGGDSAPAAPTVPEGLVGTWYDRAREGQLTFREDWSYQWQTGEGGCLGSQVPSFEAGRFILEGDAIRMFVTEVGDLGLFCGRDIDAPLLRGAIKYSMTDDPVAGDRLVLEWLTAPTDLPYLGTFTLYGQR